MLGDLAFPLGFKELDEGASAANRGRLASPVREGPCRPLSSGSLQMFNGVDEPWPGKAKASLRGSASEQPIAASTFDALPDAARAAFRVYSPGDC
jgi:hypothetical protein